MIAWLKRVGTPPVFEDRETSRIARVLYALVFIIMASAILVLLNNLFIGELVTVYALAFAELILLGVLWLTRRGRVQWAGLVLVVVLLVVVTYALQSAAGMHDIGVVTYPALIVFAGLLLNRRNFTIAILLTVASVGWLAFGELGGLFTPVVYARDTLSADFVTATVILAVTAITARMMATSLVQSLEQARREISARQHAEEELRQSEQELRAIISNLPLIFFVLDPEGTFTVLEGKGLERLGLEPGAAVGESVFDLYGEMPHIVDIVRRALAGEISHAVHDIGDIVFDVYYTPQRDVQGKTSVIGVAIDITDRVRAEKETRKLNAELEQRVAQRTAQLEATSQEMEAFVYSVSHDLRAPLRAIDGFSQIVLDEHASQLAPEAQRYLGMVGENAQRMGRLIDGLLALSRLGRQKLELQSVDMAALVRQAAKELDAECEGRQVEIEIGDLVPCQADPLLLRQVYANLLSNALKFTRECQAARIEVGCEQDADGGPVYYVRDNGIGFDMSYADKLFGVFERLHSAQEYEGTGVGLAIVQRIVQRHGGRIWAEAEVNKGATFSFVLASGTELP